MGKKVAVAGMVLAMSVCLFAGCKEKKEHAEVEAGQRIVKDKFGNEIILAGGVRDEDLLIVNSVTYVESWEEMFFFRKYTSAEYGGKEYKESLFQFPPAYYDLEETGVDEKQETVKIKEHLGKELGEGAAVGYHPYSEGTGWDAIVYEEERPAVTFYEIQNITPELAIIVEEKGTKQYSVYVYEPYAPQMWGDFNDDFGETGEHLWEALEAMQERWFK